MKYSLKTFAVVFMMCVADCSLAHDNHAHKNTLPSKEVKLDVQEKASLDITYLGNEGLMIEQEGSKVLFDPFFHHNFGIYQFVPPNVVDAIMKGDAPYQDVTAVFLSHAHDDHFSAETMLSYLLKHPETLFIAPQQAVEKLYALLANTEENSQLYQRVHGIRLAFGDEAWQRSFKGIDVSAVRIPHAGWPGRADVENIVFKITLTAGGTVMHLGDADPNAKHFMPYRQHWQKRITQVAFPPYWFYFSAEGQDILSSMIKSESSIGIHVPMKVPQKLESSGHRYFSTPGEKAHFHH